MKPATLVAVSFALVGAAVAAAVSATAFAQQKPPPPQVPVPPPVMVPKPDGEDFVVTADGTVHAGAVSLADDAVVVGTSAGERRVPREDVSLAVSGGKRVVKGEDSGLRTAWLAWLKASYDDQVPTRKIADAEPAQKAAWWTALLAAADRCAEWKMRYAATSLLAEGIEAGAWDAEAERRALEWEPTAFPFSPADAEKAKLLAVWAREIVPLGGTWVLRKESTDEGKRAPIWTTDAIAVRSRNVLVFSLDRDPKVVGSLLRQGEMTVRGLEAVFGKPETTSGEPLEIRLFKDRNQYLTESDSGGGYAPLWTAGFFSPGEMVSRFYARDKEGGSFKEGEFHEVLSHELTHHWIEMRYCAGVEFEGASDRATSEVKADLGRRADQAGHWIVEGIARFVEDQAVLFRKNAFKFDDPKAESVRDAAAQWKRGFGIPIARYMEISPKAFQFLDRGMETQVFYDQGGALCFFMMNRRGPEGRKLLVKYLRDVYGGRMTKESWKNLGFQSAADLQKEFSTFLSSLAPK